MHGVGRGFLLCPSFSSSGDAAPFAVFIGSFRGSFGIISNAMGGSRFALTLLQRGKNGMVLCLCSVGVGGLHRLPAPVLPPQLLPCSKFPADGTTAHQKTPSGKLLFITPIF
ncbi:uncharacterized protein BJX67DRAFT_244247 [Aspergillus lucknowensis]|uniref:Uncharacterized protein n=1 Tax=Aspergillus lucknowensis TaxID=176173 RepID=A0ABR4M1J0_9EURO